MILTQSQMSDDDSLSRSGSGDEFVLSPSPDESAVSSKPGASSAASHPTHNLDIGSLLKNGSLSQLSQSV